MRPERISIAGKDGRMRIRGRTAVIVSMHKTKGSCIR